MKALLEELMDLFMLLLEKRVKLGLTMKQFMYASHSKDVWKYHESLNKRRKKKYKLYEKEKEIMIGELFNTSADDDHDSDEDAGGDPDPNRHESANKRARKTLRWHVLHKSAFETIPGHGDWHIPDPMFCPNEYADTDWYMCLPLRERDCVNYLDLASPVHLLRKAQQDALTDLLEP